MKAFKILFSILLLPTMFNFALAADYYWVNGSGGWKDYANHWATSSGGSTFHTSVPKLTDNVFFDANSFPFANDTVTVDTTAECLNMNWTGCINNPTIYGSNTITINGSLILIPGMNFATTNNIRFVSPLPGNVIDFAGLASTSLWGVEFSGYGEWTLQSDIELSPTMGQITHSGGTLNTNNFDITCSWFNSWFNIIPRTINLTGSKVYCNNLMINPGADLIFDAGTSEIILGQTWFMGNDMTFYDFTFRPNFPGEVNMMGSVNFHTLNIASDSVRGIVFESGKTIQIFDLITGARCDFIKTLRTMSPGIQATIKKITGLMQEDYLAIKDIKVIGGATFITNNGINLGNVTNWTINSSSGTTLYWVGGNGFWNDPAHWSTTSGGVYPSGNTCPPSISDNVVFDANSFSLPNDSVKVNSNIYCNNMTWTGVTNNPTFVNTSYNINIQGSLIFAGGMTTTISGTMNFLASGAGNTIFTGSHTLGAGIVFDGTGTWTFTDDFTSTSSFTHNKGTVIINDRLINVYSYYSSTNYARTLTFTTGIFTCNYWSISNSNNFTLNAGSSTVYLNGTSFTSTNLGYNSLILNSPYYTYIYGSSTFAGIYNTNTGDLYFEGGKSNQTAAFTSNGDCGNIIAIHSTITGTQAELVLLSPATVTYCSFKDMKASTSALNANSCIDEGNNTGITFSALSSVNYYWIGGAGNWNDPANWSLSSGGGANPGGCIPTMADNVFFDANSGLGGQTVTINADAYCRDFTFTANNSFIAGTSTLNVYGSFTLTNTLTVSFTGSLYFRSNSPGNTINTAGRTIRSQVYFDGDGSWTLAGAFTTLVSNYKSIYFYKGTLNTNNFNVTTYYFSSYTTSLRQLNLGSSTVNVTYWNIDNGLNMTIVPGTSTINVSTGNFDGGGLIYYNVNLNTTSYASVYGSNTFNNLSMATCTHLSIEGGTTQTFSNINFPNGTGCSAYFDLTSTQPGIPATFYKDGVAVNKSWLRITDVKATGTATFNAANSMGIGDCSGWSILSGGTVDYYWIGNSGNWDDPAHWSYTSGGVPNPALCIPDADDNVFFDAGSFTLPNQVVNVNVEAYCMNMDWTGVTQYPEFAGWSSTYINGSLLLNAAMNHSYSGTYYFTNSSPATITCSGKMIYGIVIAGFSTVTMNDDLNLNWSGLTLNSGTFITNNFDINGLSSSFYSNSASPRVMTLGSSDLYFSSWSVSDPTNFVLNAGTSNIHLGNNTWQFIGGGLPYNNVFIEKYPWGSTQISGDNTFNILFFEPGCRISFEKSSTQTTTNLFATGTQTDPIEFISNEVGTAFDIVQTTVFCSDWLILKDCHVSGSTFYAGVHSIDNGGNAGWTWSGVTANDQYPAALCENTAGSGTASGVNLTLLQPAIDGGAPGHIHVWFSDPLLSIPVPVPTNVTVSDGQMFYDLVSNGTCNNVATAIYTVNPKPVISLAGTDPLCHGDNNGAIDATITVGTPPFTYIWSNSETTEDISGLIIGTYTLTVTDTYGCVNSNATTLSEPATLAATESHVNVSCFGVCDGSIDITTSGGIIPYMYQWTGPSGYSSISEDITGLCAGTYDVTVTDANSCTTTISVVITEPALLTAILFSNDATCNGTCNGTISLVPSGGTLPYSYSWTGPSGFTSTTQNLSGLCPGIYDLTITDSHLCTFITKDTIIDPSLVTFTETHTDLACNSVCTGTINVTPSGGVGIYNMIWSNSFIGFSMTNLCAGNYTGTITDGNGCFTVVNITIDEPLPLTGTTTATNITCPGLCTGAIDMNVSGGTPSYDYYWTGPSGFTSTSEDISGLCVGIYNLTITDDNSCTSTITAILTQPAAWSVTETHTNILCNGVCSGAINTTVSGATPPYIYSWQGPASFTSTSEDLAALCAGTYDLTITDDASCTYLTSITITEPLLLEITSQTSTNITCNNLNDGTVTVVASGGNGTLQYNIGSGNQATGIFTGLSAGTYTVTVSDDNSCTALSNTYIITNPAALNIVSETSANVTCFLNSDGEITIVAAGGTVPITYDIGAGAQSNGIFGGLPPANYTVTVTDNNGCTISGSIITITQPSELLISSETFTDLTCFESGDGTINIQVTGGIGLYEYTLGSLTQSGGIFVGLDAGSYQVLVTDGNGCQEYSSVLDLEEPSHIDITEVHTDVSSCGVTDGSITLTVSGGTPGYSFNWEGPGTFTATTQDITGLAGGIYYLTVTDDTLCTENLTVIISETGAPTVTAVVTNNSCYGDCEGTISTTTTGGTAPFTYTWWNGMLGDTITGLCAGTYILTVTDDSLCSAFLIAEITQPDSIIITTVVTAETCHSACDGTITVNTSGGSLPYTFDLGTGSQASNSFSGLCPAAYLVTVTDNNGCTNSASDSVVAYSLTLSFTNTDVSCNSLCDGMSTVAVTGTTGPYTYLWSNSDVTLITANLCAGIHDITVSDVSGCTTTGSDTITEPPILAVTMSSTDDHSLNDGTATASVTGGTPPYIFNWSSGGSDSTETGLTAGIYYVTITDANGCEITDTVEVLLSVGISFNDGISVINIYPNPFHDILNVNIENLNEEIIITVLDISGRRVISEKILPDGIVHRKYELEGQAEGMYFIRITGSNINHTEKLILR